MLFKYHFLGSGAVFSSFSGWWGMHILTAWWAYMMGLYELFGTKIAVSECSTNFINFSIMAEKSNVLSRFFNILGSYNGVIWATNVLLVFIVWSPILSLLYRNRVLTEHLLLSKWGRSCACRALIYNCAQCQLCSFSIMGEDAQNCYKLPCCSMMMVKNGRCLYCFWAQVWMSTLYSKRKICLKMICEIAKLLVFERVVCKPRFV